MTQSPANANAFANLAAQLKQRDPADIPMWLQTWLILGEYGSGKSTLAASFEDHAYYDIQHGAQNIERTEVDGLANTWASFSEFIDALAGMAAAKQPLPFKTLVIDDVESLWQLCVRHVYALYGWTKPEDGDRGEGWLAPRREFKRVVGVLFRLHKMGLLGTIFLAHETTQEVKVGLTYKADVIVPKISDKDIAVWLPGEVQIVMRAAKTNVNPIDASVVWEDRRFILQTSAGQSHAAVKDRTKRLPAYLPTSYAALKAAYDKKTKEN